MRRVLFAIFLTAAGSLYAGENHPRFQAQAVKWIEKDYDFGLMKEVLGPKTGRSRFVNSGEAPIHLLEAHPTCGCTSVEYPEDPIAPGDTAVITFTYNPAGRPGRFEKSIRLTFADGSRTSIPIIGNVLGTPESLEQFYPVEVGPLRLSEDIVDVGDVAFGRAPVRFVNAYNQRPDTVRPHAVSSSAALKVAPSAEAVGPGDLITYSFTFDSHAAGMSGPIEIPVEIFPDAGSSESHMIRFRANVGNPPATLVPKDAAKVPRVYITPGRIDLGDIVAGATARFEFTILNQGKSTLEIKRVHSASDAVAFEEYPEKVKSGKSVRVEGRLDTSQLGRGPIRVGISVQTNDPARPVTDLDLTAIIE